MMLDVGTIHLILKSKGLRVTQARILILDMLIQQQGPISHQHIERLLEQDESHIDRVTIYRTLHSLTECGILHKITGLDRSYSYAYKSTSAHKDHEIEHPHFVCERCSHTFCLPNIDVPKIVPTPTGFELKYTEVKLFGYCPECN